MDLDTVNTDRVPQRVKEDPLWATVGRKTILEGIVGSEAHGISLGQAHDDRDYMGVFTEPPRFVIGNQGLEHYMWRTQPDGVRSNPGDIDAAYYSLRKFVKLCCKGNPSILTLLWMPEDGLTICRELGHELRALRTDLITKETYAGFLGYTTAQFRKLDAGVGQRVHRPKLVEKYGYDTKFAAHAIRLGVQGYTLFTDGYMPIPLPADVAETILDVRAGLYTKTEAMELGAGVIADLANIDHEALPAVDHDKMNAWLVEAYFKSWFP